MRKENNVRGKSFSNRLYSKLKTSILALVFTSYRSRAKKSFYDSKIARKVIEPAASALSSKIASSGTTKFLSAAAKYFLSLKLRVYGTAVLVFGVYTALFYFASNFILSGDRRITEVVIGLVAALSALPLVFSDDTLSGALTGSKIGRYAFGLTGIRPEAAQTAFARGKTSYAFLIGVALGVISYFTSPCDVISVVAGLLLLWIISSSPEFGVIITAFSVPLASTWFLTALVVVTASSYVLKLIRGKRYITFETIDVAVLGIFLVLLFSSIAAPSNESADISLRMALYIAVYFLAASLLKSKEWLDRATTAIISGSSLSSAIIALAFGASFFFPGIKASVAPVFGDSLLGLRLAGIDPTAFNMVLTVAIPAALSHIIVPPKEIPRSTTVISMIVMTIPLLEFRSVYAVGAIALSLMLLLMIYSSRFIYLPVAVAAILGGGYFIFPAAASKVIGVLTSGFDSFATIRLPAWQDAADILSRVFIGGAGFGAGAFRMVSSARIHGGEVAGKAYNTFLQFWIESGILGFVLLVAFVWLVLTASFTVFDRIDLAKRSPALKSAAPRERSSSDSTPYDEEFALTRRIAVAGPFCSVVGLFLFGMAENVWGDHRVFLFFWIAAGVMAAGIRGVREEIKEHEATYNDRKDPATSSECDIRID